MVERALGGDPKPMHMESPNSLLTSSCRKAADGIMEIYFSLFFSFFFFFFFAFLLVFQAESRVRHTSTGRNPLISRVCLFAYVLFSVYDSTGASSWHACKSVYPLLHLISPLHTYMYPYMEYCMYITYVPRRTKEPANHHPTKAV